MPDVVIPPTYISTFSVVAYAQGYIDDFINDYCKRHYEELEGKVVPTEYRFDEEGYGAFVEWMKGKEVAWENPANHYWKEFTKAAEKESWKADIKAQMEQIEKTLAMDTEDYLWLYKKDIQEIIENQMVARYCYSKGGVKHTIPGDEVIKQAVELLSDEARYNHILAEQDTQRKVENK
jgi:carboxyl-terminal processing protease